MTLSSPTYVSRHSWEIASANLAAALASSTLSPEIKSRLSGPKMAPSAGLSRDWVAESKALAPSSGVANRLCGVEGEGTGAAEDGTAVAEAAG